MPPTAYAFAFFIPLYASLPSAVHAQTRAALTTAGIAARAVPSTVTILSLGRDGDTLGIGSGFVVRPGIVLTNWHVIEKAAAVAVFTDPDSASYPAEFVAGDELHDVAALRVRGLAARALPTTTSVPEVGEQVVAIGSPLGLSRTVTAGIVSALRIIDERRLIQVSVPVSPGSSGGPALDHSGRVFGLVTSGIMRGQALNFVTPVQYGLALVRLPVRVGRFPASALPTERVKHSDQTGGSPPVGSGTAAGGTVQPARPSVASGVELPIRDPKSERFVVDSLGPGMSAALAVARLKSTQHEFLGCFYSKQDPIADCRLGGLAHPLHGIPSDTVRIHADRASGGITSIEFRGYMRLRVLDSAYTVLAKALKRSWGGPTRVYGLTDCTEWGSRDRGGWLCKHQQIGMLQLYLFDNTLSDSAKAIARRVSTTSQSASEDLLLWWPVWEPFFLRDARAGERLEVILSEMEVGNRSSSLCERQQNRHGSLETCHWSGVRFSLAGRHPQRLVAKTDRKTRRTFYWRLEFELMPREEAYAFATAIARELETSWGPPTEERDGSAKWKRPPFEAEVHALCEDVCKPGERWQVWVMMDAFPGAAERDEADVSPY